MADPTISILDRYDVIWLNAARSETNVRGDEDSWMARARNAMADEVLNLNMLLEAPATGGGDEG